MSKLVSVILKHAINSKNTRYINTAKSQVCCQKVAQEQRHATPDYIPVYQFPYIRPLSLINRLKLYQTVMTCVSMPVTITLNQLNFISPEAMDFTTYFGLSGCITLYGLGFLASKFIGFIYYNEKTNSAQIAYVDFWGRRKDIVIPADDIVPISELPVAPMDGLYLTFRRFSTKDTLRLSLKYGVILDKEKIKAVL